MPKFNISNEDRMILRELAKKQQEYANLPIMKEREEKWYKHNDLKGEIPMIHFETWTCEKDLLPELQCTSEEARNIELQLRRAVLNHEKINDDRVVSKTYNIGWKTSIELFDLKVETKHAIDDNGRDLGHQFKHSIDDLEKDLQKLRPSKFIIDREITLSNKANLDEIFGDILPVKITMGSLGASLSQKVVHFMGMETMIYSMVDYPDEFHELMKRMTEDYIAYFKLLEKENLLLYNNGNDHLGQGSFGFTNDLPKAKKDKFNNDKCNNDKCNNEAVTLKDCWLYMDSQETVSISPDMFGEFFCTYYKSIADNFGLLSYGCCEPVHPIWDKYVSKFNGVRKVSISPWCDEAFMGEKLRGANVIFHRKPSPNFVGVGKELDEEAFEKHVKHTIDCAKGCKLEFSFRDIYNLEGRPDKPARAVAIVREQLEKHWK